MWTLGGSNIGQKNGGKLTKILPARQTHFWEFFGQPFGENTFSKNTPPKQNAIYECIFCLAMLHGKTLWKPREGLGLFLKLSYYKIV